MEEGDWQFGITAKEEVQGDVGRVNVLGWRNMAKI